MSAAAGIPIIGSLISGLQSRSAANNAEKALLGSYTNAGEHPDRSGQQSESVDPGSGGQVGRRCNGRRERGGAGRDGRSG